MVKKIVGDELFRRYDELLLASALNTMNDIVSDVHCDEIRQSSTK